MNKSKKKVTKKKVVKVKDTKIIEIVEMPKLQQIASDFTDKVADTPVVEASISHDRLLAALYWVHDAFERAGIQFFLINTTYKQAVEGEDLAGDRIEIGVRWLEWTSGGKNILDTMIGEYLIEEGEIVCEYKHDDVPIFIHIYEDNSSLGSLDSIVYRHEFFRVPNPYDGFEQLVA